VRGPLFALRCLAEAVHDMVAGRFVTTVVVTALLISVSSLVS
jgi:hypothetical protein